MIYMIILYIFLAWALWKELEKNALDIYQTRMWYIVEFVQFTWYKYISDPYMIYIAYINMFCSLVSFARYSRFLYFSNLIFCVFIFSCVFFFLVFLFFFLWFCCAVFGSFSAITRAFTTPARLLLYSRCPLPEQLGQSQLSRWRRRWQRCWRELSSAEPELRPTTNSVRRRIRLANAKHRKPTESAQRKRETERVRELH